MKSKAQLVNLGNVTIDDVIMYDGTVKMGCLGGDVIYATAAARLFIDDVRMIAPIGNDYPEQNIALLNKFGMNTSGFAVRNIPTHRNWVIYEKDGRRFWINRTDGNNFYQLSPLYADIPDDSQNASAYLILAMDLLAQADLISGLRKQDRFIVLDPQEDYILGNEDQLMKLIRMVDIFMPSEIEVYRLLGHKDYDRAVVEFQNAGCKRTVIKLGSEGCFIYDSLKKIKDSIPCYKTKAVDTTGAGDSFCGGFVSQFINTQDMKKSAVAGTIAASFAVEDFGAQGLMRTTREQAANRMREFCTINGIG